MDSWQRSEIMFLEKIESTQSDEAWLKCPVPLLPDQSIKREIPALSGIVNVLRTFLYAFIVPAELGLGVTLVTPA